MFEDLLKEKLEQIRTVGKTVISGFVPDEIAEQRYSMCLECEYFENKRCRTCRCYMPLKVIFENVQINIGGLIQIMNHRKEIKKGTWN